ncbi:unnamed protein product, partial [Didymodactylos carnosus]
SIITVAFQPLLTPPTSAPTTITTNSTSAIISEPNEDDDVIYFDKNEENNFNTLENNNDNNNSMDFESLDAPSPVDTKPLHAYTSLTADEFCSNLLNVFRDSNVCKSHSDRLLSLIQSALPAPNNLLHSMEKLLQQLNIDANLFRKRVCTICKSSLPYSENQCPT